MSDPLYLWYDHYTHTNVPEISSMKRIYHCKLYCIVQLKTISMSTCTLTLIHKKCDSNF